MADISKIKLPNGTEYNLKDATVRADYVSKSAELQTTNPFAPASLQGPYISKIDNAFYAADKRWTVTATAGGSIPNLFDGSYETNFVVPNGTTSVITMDFSNEPFGYFPGYAYGYILVSVYYVAKPASISCRAYCNYKPHGIGWFDIPLDLVYGGSDSQMVYRGRQGRHNISKIEFTIVGQTTTSTYNGAFINQIEMHLDRPDSSRNPFLTKYSAETLYYDLTAPNFRGNLIGNASNVTGTVAIANGGTGQTTAVGAANVFLSNLPDWGATPTDTTKLICRDTEGSYSFGQVTFATVWNYVLSKIKSVVLSTSTSSTSTDTAATSSAVKTAYDLANSANTTAGQALSGVNGALIYDHTYTISNGVAVFTPHVYQKGAEVTSNYSASCFTWKYRLIDGSEVTLSTDSTTRGCSVTISNMGYGGHVIGTFTPA